MARSVIAATSAPTPCSLASSSITSASMRVESMSSATKRRLRRYTVSCCTLKSNTSAEAAARSLRLQPLRVVHRAAHAYLDAGSSAHRQPFQRHPTGKPPYGFDVEAVVARDGRHRRKLLGGHALRHQRDDVAWLALPGHPLGVTRLVDGREAHRHVLLVGLEQQFLLHRRRIGTVGNLDEQTQAQGIVDDRLADVEDVHLILSQRGCQHGHQARLIDPGDVDQNDLIRHRTSSLHAPRPIPLQQSMDILSWLGSLTPG